MMKLIFQKQNFINYVTEPCYESSKPSEPDELVNLSNYWITGKNDRQTSEFIKIFFISELSKIILK
jgi:hypothetical protein